MRGPPGRLHSREDIVASSQQSLTPRRPSLAQAHAFKSSIYGSNTASREQHSINPAHNKMVFRTASRPLNKVIGKPGSLVTLPPSSLHNVILKVDSRRAHMTSPDLHPQLATPMSEFSGSRFQSAQSSSVIGASRALSRELGATSVTSHSDSPMPSGDEGYQAEHTDTPRGM